MKTTEHNIITGDDSSFRPTVFVNCYPCLVVLVVFDVLLFSLMFLVRTIIAFDPVKRDYSVNTDS